MSKDSATVIKDGQLAVATVPQTGTLVGAASEIDATALVETADGLQLCVKTCEVGGGGGGGTVDQTYDPTSTNAQSGTAVAEAVAPALKNNSTGTKSLSIIGEGSTGSDSINIGDQAKTGTAQKSVQIGNGTGAYYSVGVGYQTVPGQVSLCLGTYAQAMNQIGAIAIGSGPSPTKNTTATASKSIAIGSVGYDNDAVVSATAQEAIQLGIGTNSNAKTFQVFNYQMLDGTTGLIPAARIGTGYDATKTQVLKNVNGTLTWVDE